MQPQLLPLEDTEVSKALERAFRKQGITPLLSTKVIKAETDGTGVTIRAHNGQTAVFKAGVCLVATYVE